MIVIVPVNWVVQVRSGEVQIVECNWSRVFTVGVEKSMHDRLHLQWDEH